jgi:hypothetical protein
MELFLSLMVLLGLVLVTIVGHLIWVGGAALLRALSGPHGSSAPAEDALVHELRELDATRRQVRHLCLRGELDRATADQVEQAVNARRRLLGASVAGSSPLGQLERLVAGATDPRRLTPRQRQDALALYRQLGQEDQAALTAAAHLMIARILRMAGLASRALNAYRRLLENHPVDEGRAAVALEAGRFAAREGMEDLARPFVEQALAMAQVLSAADREEAETLLRWLDRRRVPVAITREVLEAIPAIEAPAGGRRETPVEKASPVAAGRRAPLEAPPAPAPTAPPQAEPPRPRRRLADVLATFMEERNILWGELAGGLLIVGCSIALVITLWQSLEELPYFPFLIFAAITAALFGAGEYTLHHWKLAATSRGLLVIALLLAPLNLLALADPGPAKVPGALDAAVKAAALLLAVGLVRGAGRDLIGTDLLPGPIDRRWLLALAVAGAAGSQLVLPRPPGAGEVAFLLLLGGIPAACHLAAGGAVVAGLVRAARRGRPLEARQANALFLFLGISAFALLAALGFLLSQSADIALTLRHLAVPLAAAGIPLVAGGLLVHQSITTAETANVRTIGTGVAAGGVGVMLLGVALAWPHPWPLLLAALLDGAVLTAFAFRCRLPALHAAALPCLALGFLLACNLSVVDAGGAGLAAALFAPDSGVALLALVVSLVGLADALARKGQHAQAVAYALGSAGCGLVSLAATAWHGIEAPVPAAVAFVTCGTCALAGNLRWQRRSLPYAGLGLLVAGSLWALFAARSEERSLWAFAVSIEAMLMALTAVRLPDADTWRQLRDACRDTAVGTGVLALLLALTSGAPVAAVHACTAAALAATAFLLAWAIGWPEWTFAGAALALASLVYLLVWIIGGDAIPHPLMAALLGHATLAFAAGLIADRIRPLIGPPHPSDRSFRSLYAVPLGQAARLVSVAAVPLLVVPGPDPLTLAGYGAWLAALWLLVAIRERSPAWFTAFQAALAVTAGLAATAWLQGQPWVQNPDPRKLSPWLDPRSLHAYGIGLALLGLAGAISRLALSKSALFRELLPAAWPSPDRVLLGGVVVLQLGLALVGVAGGVAAELVSAWKVSADARTWDAGAWVLLGVLALALAASLWREVRFLVVLGLLVLAATVPVLAAGPFDAVRATASALRWGEALCFLACSALVWLRRPLARLAGRAGIALPRDDSAGRARVFLLYVAGSVVLLTMMVAIGGFQGIQPGGPAAGTIFDHMGWVLSSVGPLVLLVVGLVGHALRERSAAYAFAAGLLADTALVGGYALGVVTAGGVLGEAEAVRSLQLASLGASLWALGWLLARPWVHAWREDEAPLAGRLMRVQLGLALGGLFVLAGGAAFAESNWKGTLASWAVEAGTPLGWLAFAAAVVAPIVWLGQRCQPVRWQLLFAEGLVAVTLAAGSIEGLFPGGGFRSLVLGWAGYLLLWSLIPFVGRRLVRGVKLPGWPGVSFAGAARVAELIAAPAGVVVLWALLLEDGIAAAAAVGTVSLACALVAAWRGNERLAFLAGLGANLAVSLLVAHLHRPQPLARWLVPLVQANAMASAAVALVWLLLRRPDVLRLLKKNYFIDTERILSVPGPLLVLQGLLGLAVHTLLLLAPLGLLLLDPGSRLPADFHAVGLGGWLVLPVAAAAALLVLGEVRRGDRIHVLGLCGLSVGVLAACAVIPWDTGNWLSYHALLAGWGTLGLAAVAAGSAAVALRRAGRKAADGEPQAAFIAGLFPTFWVRRWLEAIGAAVVLLALRGAGADPWRPLAPAVATFLVSLMAAALALWDRRGSYVYASGLLFDLTGLWLWASWGEQTVPAFLLANALGLGLSAALWAGVHLARPTGFRREAIDAGDWPPFPHLAAAVCLVLLGVAVVPDWLGGYFGVSEVLVWAALAATGLTLAFLLWDSRAPLAPGGLYILGLLGLCEVMRDWSLRGVQLEAAAALGVAIYAALASWLSWTTARRPDLADRLCLPPRPGGWPGNWFVPAQAVVGDVVVLLSLHVCLAPPTLAGRLAAPAALLFLAASEVLLATTPLRGGGDWLRATALLLGALAAGEAAWAGPDPAGAAPWLHRNALLVVALTLTSSLYGTALPRWLRRRPDWVAWGRRLGPALGGVAVLALLVLLAQEFALYEKVAKRPPLALSAVLAVIAALGLLMFSGIRFALVPGRDPLGLSERGRGLYVYAVEVLLVLLFVHVRLNLPELFTGWLARYWTVIVMLIAFLGVGLGEFFERRGLRVLSEPLQHTGVFLPLLPLLAFWGRPLAPLLAPVADRTPGLRPWVDGLAIMPGAYNSYALLWFLAGVLYGVLAQARHSFRFALLAALAANAGVWSLLAHNGVAFLVHPQAWLIPLAVILLVSEHVNRNRLRPEVALGLRYLGISLIYVASTADLFIAGVGNSVVLPILLAVLAVAGMLAGIVLRVRAFLFVGISFLLLDVFAMIWHAAVDRYHTWVWWASGIVLGAAILALFALFEKRRNDVLHLIDEIKRWD